MGSLKGQALVIESFPYLPCPNCVELPKASRYRTKGMMVSRGKSEQ
jgi:hypothetical protein